MDSKDSPELSSGKQNEPDPMQVALRHIELEARAIRHNGYGGLITVISHPRDDVEERQLISNLVDHLGIERTDVVDINIENVANAIELGIERYKLGIPEKDLVGQKIEESVFQCVYRFFGTDGAGWQIGVYGLVNRLVQSFKREETDLTGTPFEEFLETLDLNFGETPQGPKLLVLHYPPLDVTNRLQKLSDAQPENIPPEQVQRIDKFLRIYSLISQVYPSRFQDDNPQGHTVVNIIDNSYRWYAARNSLWTIPYQDRIVRGIKTPTAHREDARILNLK